MANPREIALKILLDIENDRAFSNLELNHTLVQENLPGRDNAFISALVYGVLERRITLDYIIRQYSKIPLRKIETATKVILRMGILQLLFMDKVPESAAVNESVNLAKRSKLQRSAGFINGILRSITRAEEKYRLPDKNKDKLYYYSILYSAPQELVQLWMDAYGEENTVQLLAQLSGRPPLCVRVNTIRNTRQELEEILDKEGVEYDEIPFLPNGLHLYHTGSLLKLQSFYERRFFVQDASSQLCVQALDPKPGQLMLDICAAPGGKSFTSAMMMENKGKILAFDDFDQRVRLMEQTGWGLFIDIIRVENRDGTNGEPLPTADRILCDVPCSGLGVLSRKPEIRYKDGLLHNDLPKIQYQILSHNAQYLAPGGRLVYSTCTLNPRENNEQTARFLREHPDFTGVKLDLPEDVERAIEEEDYEITLMPHTAHTDGFYFAVFTRRTP